jgi:hypothetical protein
MFRKFFKCLFGRPSDELIESRKNVSLLNKQKAVLEGDIIKRDNTITGLKGEVQQANLMVSNNQKFTDHTVSKLDNSISNIETSKKKNNIDYEYQNEKQSDDIKSEIKIVSESDNSSVLKKSLQTMGRIKDMAESGASILPSINATVSTDKTKWVSGQGRLDKLIKGTNINNKTNKDILDNIKNTSNKTNTSSKPSKPTRPIKPDNHDR